MGVGKHYWFFKKVKGWTISSRGDFKSLWKQTLEGGNFSFSYSTYWGLMELIYCLFVFITEIKIRYNKKGSETRL